MYSEPTTEKQQTFIDSLIAEWFEANRPYYDDGQSGGLPFARTTTASLVHSGAKLLAIRPDNRARATLLINGLKRRDKLAGMILSSANLPLSGAIKAVIASDDCPAQPIGDTETRMTAAEFRAWCAAVVAAAHQTADQQPPF